MTKISTAAFAPITSHDDGSLNSPDIITSHPTLHPITLAVSAQWHVFPTKFDWLVREGFALEYTPDPQNLTASKDHLSTYLAAGTPARHHGYFPGYEIGDRRPGRAEEAMQLHLRALEAMEGIGEQQMTVHVGLTADTELDHATVVGNLHLLVNYAQQLGIAVSLENLRSGPTSNPEIMLDWTRRTGAGITMDIGHAVSCARVANGTLKVCEIIDMYRHNLVEVHFYESETDRHHAPRNMDILGPVVDKLLTTECNWWTIELDTPDDILHTRELLAAHLSASHPAPGSRIPSISSPPSIPTTTQKPD